VSTAYQFSSFNILNRVEAIEARATLEAK